MEINNYFNQLRQMFETEDGTGTPPNNDQAGDNSGQNTNTQSAEADWKGFTANIDNFIEQVLPLKEFFQSFVNTNSSRTDESGKNALNLANKYLNEAVDIEQTLNKAKQTISASTANELQALKSTMDEAKKAAEAKNVNLEETDKADNQTEETPKPEEKPEGNDVSSNETNQNNDPPEASSDSEDAASQQNNN